MVAVSCDGYAMSQLLPRMIADDQTATVYSTVYKAPLTSSSVHAIAVRSYHHRM